MAFHGPRSVALLRPAVLYAVLLLLLSGCGGSEDSPTYYPVDRGTVNISIMPTWRSIQDNVFTPRCSTCHTAAHPNLDLTDPASRTELFTISSFGPAYVIANDSDGSVLIWKLEGVDDLGGLVGERMPFGGPYLDQDTIDVIRAWIDGGAAVP
jgi:hypothetical protein